MSDLHLIQETLARTARRRRLDRGLRLMWQGLTAAAAGWIVLVVFYKFLPLPDLLVWLSWIVIPLGAAAGFFAGWLRPVSLSEAARWVDHRQKLQERVSTALEVAQSAQDENWKSLVVSDAARNVSKVNLRDLLPFNLPAASRWALLILILGAGLGFVPEYRSRTYIQQKKDAQAIQQTGRELANLAKRNLQSRPPAVETTKKSLEQVQELGMQMAKAQLTRGEALKDLASITDKLKEQTRELAKNQAIRNLERAARNAGSKGGAPSADLQQKLENMAKQSGGANPDALEKFRNDLEKAKDSLNHLPKGDSPEAKDAKDKLEASLADLAKQAKDLGMDLPSLAEAIAALKAAQPDQVLKDLQMAEVELEKVEAMAKALEKMQLQAQKLGKDLAEQLKNGQAEAAESTLRKMQKALAEGKLNPEDVNKIMKEVSEALDPAKQYGEVGDFLKNAARNLTGGDRAQAGQNLGKAADALAKMAGELGDAQSLLATLEALQQAQMCIANGEGYAPGGNGKGGTPRGNKRGRGVGTWHDEESWEYPEMSDSWDNSGLTQQELDARSNTDKGDGQLADNLAPTKIKGQITPGGPMPSVTMKGVSIKGTSKVQIQEMAAAAQSEAQSALNQDQVPRAYQNAVKNYFDDLKE